MFGEIFPRSLFFMEEQQNGERRSAGAVFPPIPEMSELEVDGGPTKKIYCSKIEAYLSNEDEKIFFAINNDCDTHQEWVQHFISIDDPAAFVLQNKATGQALWRSREADEYSVRLVPFNNFYQDASVLWKAGRQDRNGFCSIVAANDKRLFLNIDRCNNLVIQQNKRAGPGEKIWKLFRTK